MQGQIGSWDKCLAITFDREALSWLDSLNVDRRVLVSVSLDRSILVLPDAMGHKVTFRGQHNAVGYGVFIDWGNTSVPPLPRFELLELKFKPTKGIALELKLPADHMLPWPKLRDCETYSATEVAMAELERRLTSAAKCFKGQRPASWSWVQPGEGIRALLPKGFWAETLRRAIALSTS
jgi:hypothetical protein